MMRISPLTVTAMATIWFVWGATYLAIAWGLEAVPPLLLMGSRSAVGGAILVLFSGARRTDLLRPAALAQASLCGALMFVGCHGVLAAVEQRAPSGLAAVMLATIPLWMALIKLTVRAPDRPSWARVSLLAPGLAGVALVAGVGASAPAGVTPADAALLTLASASWAAGSLLAARWSRDLGPATFAGVSLVAGGLALIAGAAFGGEFARVDFSALWPTPLLGWLFLTLAGTVLAFLAYMWLLRRLRAELVATYTFVNPLVALLLGWLLRGERPTGLMLAGAALVIAAVAGQLVPLPRRKERAPCPSGQTTSPAR